MATGIVDGPWCAVCGLARLRGQEPDPCDVEWCQTYRDDVDRQWEREKDTTRG